MLLKSEELGRAARAARRLCVVCGEGGAQCGEAQVDPRHRQIAPDEGVARPKREEPAGGSGSARCDTRLQALDDPQSHATEPTRMRCVRHDTARPRDNWPVSPPCVSVACGCVSAALLTFLQPRMRNHTYAQTAGASSRRATRRRCHTSHRRRRLSRECARPGARRPTPRCAPRGPSHAVRLCSTR